MPTIVRTCVPDAVRPWTVVIAVAAERFELPVTLLWALVRTESRGRYRVESRAGAVGLAQLMPATARAMGVHDRTNPYHSVMGGARYLRLQINRFDGDLRLALAAYNAGPGAVLKYGGVPPFEETQRYVPKVLRRFSQYRDCMRAERRAQRRQG